MKRSLAIFAAFAALMLASCGGGSPAPSGGSGPQQNEAVTVNGAFGGTYTVQGAGSLNVLGAISQSGFGFFADSHGFLYVLPSLSTSGGLSGTLNGYSPPGGTFPNSSPTAQFSVTGSADASGTSITGTFSSSGESGTFSLSPLTMLKPSLAGMAGTYSGFYIGSGLASVNLTIASDGTVTGSDGTGCTIAGKITAASGGIFTFAANSGTGVDCAGQLTGIAFESGSDFAAGASSGTYLYVGATGSGVAFAAELVKQ